MASEKRSRNQVAPQAQKKRKIADSNTHIAQEVEHESATNILRSQVFGTTEILEAIPEHLPGNSLSGVQRVSKTFQATILGSTRIQHKMFLRIRNNAAIPWALRRREISVPDFEQVPGSDRNERGARRRLLTPVDMNPSFNYKSDRRGIVSAYTDKKIAPGLKRRRRFAQQDLEQLSIAKTFISDSHCDHIDISLGLTLGVRLPTRVTVLSVVKSRTPLSFDALIAKALSQEADVNIQWRGDGYTSLHLTVEEGVPKEILDKLERQTGLQLFFRFSDFSFDLKGVVAPTDEDRAAVAGFSEENA